MILLQVQNVTKSFAGEEVLINCKLEVKERERVALVGRNGAGKSTLLKIIAGEMGYDSGDIVMPKNKTFGYLEQHSGLESPLSIWDEMMTVFEPLKQQEQRLRSLELQMADPVVYNDAAVYEKVTQDYDQLQLDFKEAGGFRYESDTRSILHGLQFFPDDYDKPVQSLSGGQRTRLALAKQLLIQPDLLLLDEPTNHLDIETLAFLENYLKNYPGAIVIVSHDRYFLDQVTTLVYEISRRKMTRYVGNYSAYLDQKALDYERDVKQFDRQQEEKAKLEDFISRNLARASTTKMAQSRRKVLEKTDWMDSPSGDEKSAAFGFSIERESGNDVLRVDNVAIGYDTNVVASGITFPIYKRDRIALIGPNGIGKSTLLKTVMKKTPAFNGTISYGTNVQFGYYDQDQADLKSSKTVLQELWDEWPLFNEKDIRTALGRFLFSGDDVLKPVSSLSGGEKARLALAKLMLLKANTLILDEPTNHLDLDSKEVLENALLDFPGTLLFVSHDRYFINRIATKVVELAPDGSELFLGDYDYYLEKKEEERELQLLAAQDQAPSASSPTTVVTTQIDKSAKKRERQINRRLTELEQEMQDLDEQKAVIEAELCKPEVFGDHEQVGAFNKQLEAINELHDTASFEWLELQEELETL
ncbi:ABC-F family ATP-binding cassette domain-containing protein [Chryseomicrobium sp. FSL W7-1435]|uniref:ABC-F family ATP-binding cassette domain-containing protein n=1 Tax=Chryseomicrobium sp. FSL W7-1435 TaxID=2921704 RepID=UPI00315B0944